MAGVLGGIIGSIQGVPAFTATGGTITTSGAYTIHTFTSNGNFTVSAGTKTVEALVVGGGAGAQGSSSGSRRGGGSGGGGSVTTTSWTAVVATYAAVVGGGGGISAASAGTASSINGTSASGGAVADGTNYTPAELLAASHRSGSSGNSNLGGLSDAKSLINYYYEEKVEAYVAQTGAFVFAYGGGGGSGGAGSAGQNNSTNSAGGGNSYTAAPIGGDGGVGTSNSYSGTSVEYGRGGGGGKIHIYFAGASVISSDGSSVPTGAGLTNRGYGGQGSEYTLTGGGTDTPFAGGSGIVIVRYLT